MPNLAQRLAVLCLNPPPPTQPSSEHYVSAVQSGNLLFVSGQLPKWGDARFLGRLGEQFNLAEGQQAAELSALNVLQQLDQALQGRLERVSRIVKLTIFVAATADFTQHSQVGNSASALMVTLFGEAGQHARTTVGVASLPRGAAVEIEAIVELHPTTGQTS
ncbi:RidA family protein [Chitinimonas viridis]|uniref:RidA family protein n=1 Tax=Chitinimonas viridis TaxID=664880 RepID=A0ABT8B3N3_9NEIS|nr:RidA family protein [Chitinimonas viridis]MDN3576148.1 RidA family protein [Chitinimonas viridis]